MLIVTRVTKDNIITYNNFNEPNPYRLIMDVVKQANWPLDMVTFTRFRSGIVARLDSIDKKEIIVQY